MKPDFRHGLAVPPHTLAELQESKVEAEQHKQEHNFTNRLIPAMGHRFTRDTTCRVCRVRWDAHPQEPELCLYVT